MKQKVLDIKNKLLALKAIKFLMSGVFAFLIDTSILIFVKMVLFGGTDIKLFETLSIAKLISGSIGMLIMFILNRVWVFGENKNQSVKKQGAKYIVINAINILIASIFYSIYSSALIQFFPAQAATHPTVFIAIANFLTEGTKMFISFFAYKYIVFR